jgi:hypothetical protein
LFTLKSGLAPGIRIAGYLPPNPSLRNLLRNAHDVAKANCGALNLQAALLDER